MVSFMAVLFFCVAEKDCYFWNSKQLHMSEAKCLTELKAVVTELESKGATPAFQCLRVHLGKEA